MRSEPELVGGFPLWSDHLERGRRRVGVRFVGRGTGALRPGREQVLRAVEPEAPPLAWARQVHSAAVLEASAGSCGEGDALHTRWPGLSLSVATADCLPVMLAAGGERSEPMEIVAIHAGWRGIAAGIVGAALDRLTADPGATVAWIGPSIGPCCYEVGEEVAERVAAVSGGEVVLPNPDPSRPNPHLDLRTAVQRQLATAGVSEVRMIDVCTRCRGTTLWSYRREGQAAGRNLAFIWVERI